MYTAANYPETSRNWAASTYGKGGNMDISEKILDGLTEDMRQKVGACNTADDLLALAKSEGVELSAEQLEAVSGGTGWDDGGDDVNHGCGNIHLF